MPTLTERFANDGARPRRVTWDPEYAVLFEGDRYEDPSNQSYRITDLESGGALWLLDPTWQSDPVGVNPPQCDTTSDEGWTFYREPDPES